MATNNINIIKHSLFFTLLSIIVINAHAQTGLNFQGVARTSNNVILTSQAITIKLSILQGSATGTADYVETRRVITNAQGLFAAVIGDTGAISTLGNFTTINWKLSPKFLKIEMDPAAGDNFITMGTTQFQYVAYAQFAKSVDAENIVGILPVSKGGTGLSSNAALKSALSLDKINNTADADKPISTKTQIALDLIAVTATDTTRFLKRINSKADTVDVILITKILGTKLNAADTIKFTKQAYSDSSLLTKLKIADTSTMLSSRIARDTLNLSNRINLKANAADTIKFTKQAYSDSSLLTKLKIADTSTMLSSRIKRDTLNLSNRINLKANAADTIKFTKQAYSDSSLLTKLKIADTSTMLSSRIARDTLSLSNRINLKANAADVTSGLALKEDATNKSTATDLGGTSSSDVLFPTQKAVKDYVSANAGSGGVADGGITNIKLADGAVSYAKFQTIPTNSILGNTSSSTTSVQAIATTGLDNVVLSTSPTITSPTLITPNIGAATATSINDVIINGFNFKFDLPSLTITGTTSLQGNNTGDDATNSKYEGLLTNGGAVDLINDQAIDGKKTFLNNITMANLLGAGSITPTTINFANGSKIGDIQNINGDDPDVAGSIDLFAPYGAKRVQINYGDSNYMRLSQDSAGIGIGNMHWKFNKDGSTELPLMLAVTSDILIGKGHLDYPGESFFDTARIGSPTNIKIMVMNEDNVGDYWNWKFNNDGNTILPGNLTFEEDNDPSIISDYSLDIQSKDFLRLRHSNDGFYTSLKLGAGSARLTIADITVANSWDYKVDGSSWFPGDLNFTDNHAINFTSTGNSTPTNNASIISTGPLFKIQTREVTETEYDEELNYGIELNYTDRNIFELRKYTYFLNHDDDDSNDDYWSAATFAHDNFNFLINKNSSQYRWQFNDDGSTILPGTLKLGNTIFPSVSGNPNDILTIDGITGNAIWKASSGGSVTGTGTTGQLSFFNGTNSISGDSKFIWDGSKNSLSVGDIPSTSIEKFELISGAPNKNSILIASPDGDGAGSQIGFISKSGSNTNTGLFQLDGVGNMLFRTMQGVLSFDNFGETDIDFRVGKRDYSLNQFVYTTPMKIKADQSVNFYSNVNISSGTLSVTGDVFVTGNVTASSFPISSDYRLKQNITPLQNSLSIIEKLNPVAYDKKQNLASEDYSIKENGFIAQELQKILPDLVYESADKDKLLSVNYTAIIPILTKGIQEQQAIIEDQKKRLEALEKLVSDLINKK